MQLGFPLFLEGFELLSDAFYLGWRAGSVALQAYDLVVFEEVSEGVLQENDPFYESAYVHLLLHFPESCVYALGLGPLRSPGEHRFEEVVNQMSEELKDVRLIERLFCFGLFLLK